MSNRIFELHDSKVETLLTTKDGQVTLIFCYAYIHESDGIPWVDRGKGLAQRAELEIDGGEIVINSSSLPSTISDGSIRVSGELRENVIPIPFASKGPFEIKLILVSGESFQLRGHGAKLNLQGEALYVEDFPGH